MYNSCFWAKGRHKRSNVTTDMSTETTLNQSDPAYFLPHKAPLILLTRIVNYGEDWLETEITHNGSSPFTNREGLTPAWVAIEYMAQTVSAYAGIKRRAKSLHPKIGFLLGTRKFSCDVDYFEQHEAITVKAKAVLESDAGVSLFDCSVHKSDGTQIGFAQLKGVQPDNPIEVANALSQVG